MWIMHTYMSAPAGQETAGEGTRVSSRDRLRGTRYEWDPLRKAAYSLASRPVSWGSSADLGQAESLPVGTSPSPGYVETDNIIPRIQPTLPIWGASRF